MQRRVAAIVVVGAAVAALSGCTGSRTARVAPTPRPAAGGSWNAVLPSPALSAADGDPGQADAAWILSRNDSGLSPRSVDPVLATAQWPEPERPSLRRPILIRVYEQPGRYYSYGPQRRYYDNARTRSRR
ncbi:MAG: hypothetical protein ACF8LK_05475 [Phycisphaerales bacterium JB041]